MHELQCKGLATTATINHSEARKVGGTHWEKLAMQIFSTRWTERQSMLVTVNSANICNSFKHKSSSIHQMKINLGWIAQRLMWQRKSWIQNYSLPTGKVLVLLVPKLQAYFQYMDTPSPSFYISHLLHRESKNKLGKSSPCQRQFPPNKWRYNCLWRSFKLKRCPQTNVRIREQLCLIRQKGHYTVKVITMQA